MALGLTADAIVRAGSGVLFLALGVFVLFVGRSRRANVALGVGLATFGAIFVFQNLIISTTPPILGIDALGFEALGSLVLYVVLVLVLVAVILGFPRGLDPRARRRALAWSAGTGSIVAVVGVTIARGSGSAINACTLALGPASFACIAVDALYQAWLAILLGWVAALVAMMPKLEPAEGRAIGMLALGLSMYPAYVAGYNLAPPRWITVAGTDRASFALALVLLACIVVLFLRVSARGDANARLARNAALALPAVALIGMVLGPLVAPGQPDTTGGIGVARVVGAVLVAWAVLRHDLLGVGLRGRTIRRGTVATGALASVLIVAQIAQNFLAAQYGLLMGGVVAGAFIFAASPIQRAIEGRGDREQARPGRSTGDRANEVYRATLRRYLRDGVLTRDEERHLAHLAGELGIDAGHAFEMRDQIERELQEVRG